MLFRSVTKKDASFPCGIELLAKIRKQIHIPIVAIGGIKLSNAKKVLSAGADAICAISAVVTKSDVAAEIKRFQNLFKGIVKKVS